MNRLKFSSVCVAVLGLLVLGPVGAAAQAAPRLGFIDSQRILAEAPGTREAQQAFEADMAQYRLELEQLEAELETLQESFDRQQATLSATIREQRQQEMQQKFIAYQTRTTELEETAQRRQQELVAPIMQKITEVIEVIRTEGSYAMILDAASGAIISADPGLDLTDQVLQRLQTTTP